MPRKPAHANADAFLAAYRLTGNISEAARAADIEKTLHYRWLARSPGYATAFAAARREVADLIEAEAIRRAKDGVLEPVFYQGLKCGAVRRYPEGLTQFLLRGLKPEVYGVKAELTGAGGGPLVVEVRFVDPKPDK